MPTSIAARRRALQADPVDADLRGDRRRRRHRRPERLDRRQGRAGVGRVEVALDRRLPLAHRGDQRRAVGDRLVGGRAQAAAQRPGGLEAGRPRAQPSSSSTVTVWPSPRSGRRALRLLGAGDPEGDRARGHVRRRVQRHVLDVDARPRPAPAPARRSSPAGWRRRRAARAGGRRRARPRAGGDGPRRRAACQAATASRSPARISSAASRSRAPTASIASATASRLLAKMSPQIAGLEPATRVASRKLGPTSGIRSESRVSSAAASPTRTLASTCGRWLTVAIRRSCASASIACGRAPRPATSALQAVVEDAAGALGRGQVPAGALEEVGAGVLHPGGLGAGQRVAADEALVVAERGDQLALGRAGVGDHASRGRWRRAPRATCSASAADRRGAEDRLGALAGLARASRRRGRSRPSSTARSRVARGPPPADHLHAASRPRRAADRAADQADAEDGDPHRSRRALDRRRQPVEHRDGVLPGHAGVGDRLAVGERPVAVGALLALDEERLEHDPDDRLVAGRDLLADLAGGDDLAGGVLAAVVVGGVDHDPLRQAGGAQLLQRRPRPRPAS